MQYQIRTDRNGLGQVTTKIYNYKNELHCEDGPAFYTDEKKEWFIEGKLHRSEGPAILINDRNYYKSRMV